MAYLLNKKSHLSEESIPATGWASMKPSMNITRDYFGTMKEVTIKLDLPPNNDVDFGRVETLRDLLKVITGTPKDDYKCKNPSNPSDPPPERKCVFFNYTT